MLSHSLKSCIESAQAFQKNLLNLFTMRSYASLQLVEALAHAEKPTTIVELSQETPFQRSYSVINKILNTFGTKSLITKTVNAESVKKVQIIDSIAFSKITKPFSDLFFNMLPQETNRKFRLLEKYSISYILMFSCEKSFARKGNLSVPSIILKTAVAHDQEG